MLITMFSKRLSGALLAAAAVFSLTAFSTINAQTTAQAHANREAVITVKGLSCSMCARALEKRLATLADARKATVNLDEQQAVVTFPPDTQVTDTEIQTAVKDAGFNVTSIAWRTSESAPEGR